LSFLVNSLASSAPNAPKVTLSRGSQAGKSYPFPAHTRLRSHIRGIKHIVQGTPSLKAKHSPHGSPSIKSPLLPRVAHGRGRSRGSRRNPLLPRSTIEVIPLKLYTVVFPIGTYLQLSLAFLPGLKAWRLPSGFSPEGTWLSQTGSFLILSSRLIKSPRMNPACL
jgi:hypothetical protein